MFSNQEKPSNVATDSKHDRHANIRKSRVDTQFPINVFSDSESRRIISANFQSQTAKPICSSETVSVIQSLSGTNIFAGRRLASQNRPKPGILSSEYCERTPAIPEAQLQWRTSTNDVPAFWSFFSTSDICDANKLDRRISTKAQHQVRSISRRFFTSQSVQISSEPSSGFHREYFKETRVDSQFRQICAGSDSTPRIPRCYLGHNTQHEVPVGTEVPNAPHGTSTAHYNWQLVPQASTISPGETQLCHISHSSGKVTLPVNAISQPVSSQASSPSTGKNSRQCDYRYEMVDDGCFGFSTDTRKPDNASSDDRCLRYWLGSSDRGNEHLRSVDRSSAIMACQSQRTFCSPRGDSPCTESVDKLSCTFINGQSYCSVVHQQRGRNQIENSSEVDASDIAGHGSPEYALNGSVLSRPLQLRGRRPIQNETLSRMAPATSGNSQNFSDVGNTRGRLICVEKGSCRSQVCDIRHLGPGCSFSQRILPTVEVQPSLGFPPPNLIPRVLSQLNTAKGHYILIAPRWEKVFWMADLQRRSLQKPYRIPDIQQVLLDTVTGVHPPNVQLIHLEAWLILGGQR
ncbi:unnamed protein product [Euphydryas editha]|uniref:Uncharacterized protein n=1 Tax=Euphydryas editha TaxID=104508 RepID=A0AAU9TZF7_EUPED|nr:unnamed protein product [Euphydryas editha]